MQIINDADVTRITNPPASNQRTPVNTVAFAAATGAQKTAWTTQGQFQSPTDAAAMLTDPGLEKLGISVRLATLNGALDTSSILEVFVSADQNLSAPTATSGTILGSTATGGTTLVVWVAPDATTGIVTMTVTLAAGGTATVRFKHRQFISASATQTVTNVP